MGEDKAMLRYSGHIHTCYSSSEVEKVSYLDGTTPWLRRVTPARIIQRAMKEGLDGIIVSDSLRPKHFEEVSAGHLSLEDIKDRAYRAVRDQVEYGVLPRDFSVDVVDDWHGVLRITRSDGRTLDYIRGIETRWEGVGKGHILAFGYREKELLERLLETNGTATSVIDAIHQAEGIAVADHPYNTLSGGMNVQTVEDAIVAGLDALEWNAQHINFLGRTPNYPKFNEKVLERAKQQEGETGRAFPVVAFNDAQGISQIANSYFDIPRLCIKDHDYIESLRTAIGDNQHSNHFGLVANWQMLNWLVLPSFASYERLKGLVREAAYIFFKKKD